jgi:hypothetical protein
MGALNRKYGTELCPICKKPVTRAGLGYASHVRACQRRIDSRKTDHREDRTAPQSYNTASRTVDSDAQD